jgi:type I restriction enzyme R subunit
MSKLLNALIAQRRKGVIDYKKYLAEVAALTKEATTPGGTKGGYPPALNTAAKRALYNNLGKDEALALKVDKAVQDSLMDGWRDNALKTKRVRLAIRSVIEEAFIAKQRDKHGGAPHMSDDHEVELDTKRILELVKNQNDY